MSKIWQFAVRELVRRDYLLTSHESVEGGKKVDNTDRIQYLNEEMNKFKSMGLKDSANFNKLMSELKELKEMNKDDKDDNDKTSSSRVKNEAIDLIKSSRSLVLIDWDTLIEVASNGLLVCPVSKYKHSLNESALEDISILNEEMDKLRLNPSNELSTNDLALITSISIEQNRYTERGSLLSDKSVLESLGKVSYSVGMVPFGSVNLRYPKEYGKLRRDASDLGIVTPSFEYLDPNDVIIIGNREDFDYNLKINILTTSKGSSGIIRRYLNSYGSELNDKLNKELEKKGNLTIDTDSDPIVGRLCNLGFVAGGRWCEYFNEEIKNLKS